MQPDPNASYFNGVAINDNSGALDHLRVDRRTGQ
jgi:hypothetical protein